MQVCAKIDKNIPNLVLIFWKVFGMILNQYREKIIKKSPSKTDLCKFERNQTNLCEILKLIFIWSIQVLIKPNQSKNPIYLAFSAYQWLLFSNLHHCEALSIYFFAVPQFSVQLQDRISGPGSIPSIDVTFDDGLTDTIVLRKFTFHEEDRLESLENCNYFGHLASDESACLSVTGCVGLEPLDFTIMGEKGGLYRWNLDGSVTQIKRSELVSTPFSFLVHIFRDFIFSYEEL